VDDRLTLQEAHALVSHLEDEVRRVVSGVAEVTSHIEPVGHHAAEGELPTDVIEATRREVERSVYGKVTCHF